MEILTLLTDSTAAALAVVFLLIGIIGSVVPMMPGPLISFITLLVYGFYDGWENPAWWLMGILFLIIAFIGSLEYWLPAFSASKTGGSSRLGTLYGIIGAIIGFFTGFLLGVIIGYAAGVFLGSLQTHRDWRTALKASGGSLLGQGLAMSIQVFGGFIVLTLFVISVYGGAIFS